MLGEVELTEICAVLQALSGALSKVRRVLKQQQAWAPTGKHLEVAGEGQGGRASALPRRVPAGVASGVGALETACSPGPRLTLSPAAQSGL